MRAKTGLFSIFMIISGVLAFLLTPKAMRTHPVDFATLVPAEFGVWHTVPNVQLVTAQDPNSLEKELYSQVLERAYVDDRHHMVMLLLAYGPSQTDRLQLHRPEICYVANGFRVGQVRQAVIDVGGNEHFPIKRLVATRDDRVEYITYWMRIGTKIANNVLRRQIIKLEYGLQGVIPDGLLVRTSVVGASMQEAYAIQGQFINALVSDASPQLRAQLLGDQGIRLAKSENRQPSVE